MDSPRFRFAPSRIVDATNRFVSEAADAGVIMNRAGQYDGSSVEVDGQAMRNYYHWLGLTYVVTLATNPALALPCGKDEHGMPFGLQVIGRLHGDAQLLAASQALEQVFAGSDNLRRPVPDLQALQAARPELKSIVTHPPETAGVQGGGGLTAV